MKSLTGTAPTRRPRPGITRSCRPTFQQAGLRKALDEAEGWAEGAYRTALARGDEITNDERAVTIRQMARYTGLSERYLDLNNLRIGQSQFGRELLRDERRTVGRFDSRYLGIVENAGSSSPEFDPSLAAVRPADTTTFNQYVRSALGYKTDAPYHILGGLVGPWDWGPSDEGYPETGGSCARRWRRIPT